MDGKDFLFVGEGDFSFSHAVALIRDLEHDKIATRNFYCTSLDFGDVVKSRYAKAATCIRNLERYGAKILHRIDATNLHQTGDFEAQMFDFIIWNFPHCGLDMPHLNTNLLRGFFISASNFLREGGEVHITLCNGQFSRWSLDSLHLEYFNLILKSAAEFNSRLYVGYETKRAYADETFQLSNCWTYAWEKRCYSPFALPYAPQPFPMMPSFVPHSPFPLLGMPVPVVTFSPHLGTPMAFARPVAPVAAPPKLAPLPPEYRVEQRDVDRDEQLREVLEKSHEDLRSEPGSGQKSKRQTNAAAAAASLRILTPTRPPQGKSSSKSPRVRPTVTKAAAIATTMITATAATITTAATTITATTTTAVTMTTAKATTTEMAATVATPEMAAQLVVSESVSQVTLHPPIQSSGDEQTTPAPEDFAATGEDKKRDDEIRSMLQNPSSTPPPAPVEEALPSDRELQAQELEVIASIYGQESLMVSEKREYTYVIKVPREREDVEHVELRVFTPPTYPSRSPPYFTLYAPWLALSRVPEIAQSLLRQYLTHKGDLVLFQWVEWLRENVQPSSSYTDPQIDLSLCRPKGTPKIVAPPAAPPPQPKPQPVEVYKIVSGEPIVDGRSQFQAHACSIRKSSQVAGVLRQLKLDKESRVARAVNVMAFRLADGHCGNDDDGDKGCGLDVQKVLEKCQAEDVVVFVSCWVVVGHGSHNRFRNIVKAAGQVLDKFARPATATTNAVASSAPSSSSTAAKREGKRP